MQRRAAIVVGLILLVTAVGLALWPVFRAGGLTPERADAATQAPTRTLVVERITTPQSMHLRFTRPNGAVADVAIVQASESGAWRPQAQIDAPGIVLGDGYPVFATPRFLAVQGLDPAEAIRPLSSDILNETADEVTVIRGWGGEIAICLWRHDKVVRAYLAGDIFDSLLKGPHAAPACEVIEALAEAAPHGAARTAAWAATLAGCATRRDAALEQLQRDCDAGEETACDLMLARSGGSSDLWPEIDDLWRWVLDMIDAAQTSAPAQKSSRSAP